MAAGRLSGDGAFARLSVTASTTGGGAVPPIAIEQFDLQPPSNVEVGFDAGWHEPEYNPATGRSWRWMSEQATLAVRAHVPLVVLSDTIQPFPSFSGIYDTAVKALRTEIRGGS